MKKISNNLALKALCAVMAIDLVVMEPVTAFASEGDMATIFASEEELLLEEAAEEASEDGSEEAWDEEQLLEDDFAADSSSEEEAVNETSDELISESDIIGTEEDVSANSAEDESVAPEDIVLAGVNVTGGKTSDITVSGIEKELRYPGKPVTFPNIVVKDKGKVLKKGTDYTVKYENNDDISTDKKPAYVVINFKGMYQGSRKVSFKIIHGWICPKSAPIKDYPVTYTGKVIKIKPTIYYGEEKIKLVEGRDYTLTYLDTGDAGSFKEPGTYYIAVSGKGKFDGVSGVTETITKNKLISDLTISKIADQTCKEGMKKPKVVVKDGEKVLTEGTHYNLEYANWNVAGTATVTVKGIDHSGYSGEAKVTYKVLGISISKAKVSGLGALTYTGKELTHSSITVYTQANNNAEKKVLKGTSAASYEKLPVGSRGNYDYTVSYKDNVKAGTASVTIKGVGKYTGSLKKTFTIKPLKLTADSNKLKVSFAGDEYYTKGGATPDAEIIYDGVELKKGKDYTIAYKNNKKPTGKGKKATATFTFKGNFKGSFSREFRILGGDLTNADVTAPDVIYKNKKGNGAAKVTVKENGKKLVAGTDYKKKIIYKINGKEIDIKTKVVPKDTVVTGTIIGLGAYEGTKTTFKFRVVQRKLDKDVILVDKDLKPFVTSYTGDEASPVVKNYKLYDKKTKSFLKTSQYQETACVLSMEEGKCRITIKGKDEYGGKKTFTVKVGPKKVN